MEISLVSFLDVPYELQLKTRDWRNSEAVAKYFKIPYISEEQHKKWLENLKKENPSSIAFIINKDSVPIGVTYFHTINYENKIADWGIYIYDENARGLGIGKIVLSDCLKFAKYSLNLSAVYLDVLKNNNRAIKLYESLGFKYIDSNNENFLRYINKLQL